VGVGEEGGCRETTLIPSCNQEMEGHNTNLNDAGERRVAIDTQTSSKKSEIAKKGVHGKVEHGKGGVLRGRGGEVDQVRDSKNE